MLPATRLAAMLLLAAAAAATHRAPPRSAARLRPHASLQPAPEQSGRVSAVTVATHADGYLDVLRASCTRGGVELTVLGFGQKWGGWAWRASLLAAHLREQPASAVVLVVDAFDVALLADEPTIRERYAAFGAPIVFGCAEGARVDRPFLRAWYGSCRGENLNAGGYMGPASELLALTEVYLRDYADERDDQLAFTRICCESGLFGEERVAIDTDGTLFYNAAHTLRPGTRLGLQLRDGRWTSARTGAQPCVLHAVGGGDMRHHLNAVGLDVSSIEVRNYALHLLQNEPQRAALFAVTAAGALVGAARLGVHLLGAP
ncbi:hypothetical protein T492DRAFT_1032738 [Pavlovales sp. CCMP2436]|nr:hypothetical protein T492DRAFT_1032738 [Pavlovales sp. CCMP2436]